MTSTEYYASVDRGNLVRTELDAAEFKEPFQMGKWLVTLVER